MLSIGAFAAVLCAAPPSPGLTVDQAIDLALTQAAQVVVARSNILIADSRRARALAAVLPTFQVILGARENFEGRPILERRLPQFCSAPFDETSCTSTNDFVAGPFIDQEQLNSSSAPRFDLSLVARQLIWDGGRSWAFLQRAEIEHDRSRVLLKVVQNNVRLDVARQFYGLARAEQTTVAFERRVALDKAQLARARARLLEGVGTEADVAAAERNFAQDKLTLAQRRFSADRARRNLNLALGRPADTAIRLVIPPPILRAQDSVRFDDIASIDELQEKAKRRRPDLKERRQQLAMAEESIDAAVALRWPSVSLDATYRRGSRRLDRVFGNPISNYNASVGLGIRWNAFQGLRDEVDIDIAELQWQNLKTNYDDFERRVLSEVQDRRQNLEIQIEVYRLARMALRPAEDTVRLSRQKREEGTATTLELRDAELRFTQAQLSAIEARLQIEVAKEELRRAVGGQL